MTNKQKLKVAIIKKGLSIAEVAHALGINASTFYRKLEKDCESFTIQQAGQLAKLLNLSIQEMHDIFFAD